MTEEQKTWEISVKMSSEKCEFKEIVKQDLLYTNYGDVKCGHKLGGGHLCTISNKNLCPLKTIEFDYSLNPKLQVNKDDV